MLEPRTMGATTWTGRGCGEAQSWICCSFPLGPEFALLLSRALNSWQSEQINKSLYYLSFLSIVFLPLSIVTGVFGMNVGGVPWTEQRNPANRDGFVNVMLICVVILLLLLLCFLFPSLYSYVSAWRTHRELTRSSSQNRRHLKLFKGHKEGYMRL